MIETADTNREAWLDFRRTGIGSSDAAAVCGLSPWNTPYGVYCAKVFGTDADSSPEMQWGLRLEPAIAQAFTEQTGLSLESPPMLWHADRPWQMATLDRRVVGNGPPVELKTSKFAANWGPSGTDSIPEYYFLQVTHQMIVTDTELAYLAALIGGSDFRIYTIRLDPVIAERLTEIEAAFWDRVKSLNAPPPDWSHPSTPELLEQIHVPMPGSDMHCDQGSELHLDIDEYRVIQKEIAEREKQKKELKARIISAMGSHATLLLPDGSTVKRRVVNRAGYAVEQPVTPISVLPIPRS